MDLICAHCGDNLGKASQLDALAFCGNCGTKTPNPESTPTKEK
jgi:DNA-directed RNA polymerase subunit RPC12/RpoP